jgi:hypothetical protein
VPVPAPPPPSAPRRGGAAPRAPRGTRGSWAGLLPEHAPPGGRDLQERGARRGVVDGPEHADGGHALVGVGAGQGPRDDQRHRPLRTPLRGRGEGQPHHLVVGVPEARDERAVAGGVVAQQQPHRFAAHPPVGMLQEQPGIEAFGKVRELRDEADQVADHVPAGVVEAFEDRGLAPGAEGREPADERAAGRGGVRLREGIEQRVGRLDVHGGDQLVEQGVVDRVAGEHHGDLLRPGHPTPQGIDGRGRVREAEGLEHPGQVAPIHQRVDRAPDRCAHRVQLQPHLHQTPGLRRELDLRRGHEDRGRERHALEGLAVGAGVRVAQRPPAHERANLVADRLVRDDPSPPPAPFRVLRELLEHAQQRVGDRFVTGVARRLHQVDDRVHGHAFGRAEEEAPALGGVAAHGEQPPQGAAVQRGHEVGDPPPEGGRLLRLPRLQFVGDLQHVADDHLIVGVVPAPAVDGAGDPFRRGVEQLLLFFPGQRILGRAGGERRAGQAQPQLGRARPGGAGLFGLVGRRLTLHEPQPLVVERIGRQVRPAPLPEFLVEPERATAPVGVLSDEQEELVQLLRHDPALEGEGPEMVPMQAGRELEQHRVLRVRGDALDHELCAGDAEGQGGFGEEQLGQEAGDLLHGRRERRMPLRVHAEPVQRDGETDEEVAELPRQGGRCLAGGLGRRRHCPGRPVTSRPAWTWGAPAAPGSNPAAGTAAPRARVRSALRGRRPRA